MRTFTFDFDTGFDTGFGGLREFTKLCVPQEQSRGNFPVGVDLGAEINFFSRHG